MPHKRYDIKRYEIEAGIRMRELRTRRGLTLRDVEEASTLIAKARGNRRGVIMPSQLSLIEQQGKVPNIYRLAALAKIYKVALKKLLSFYRV